MKNILNIEVNTICTCNCYENIYNGEDQILIRFERDNPINPKIQIKFGENPEETYDINFINGVGIYEINLKSFMNGIMTFKFTDDDYDGSIFTINHQYRTSSRNRTLVLDKINDYSYKTKYLSTIKASSVGIGDDFEVDENGELKTKKVTSIKVTKSNDIVSNVTFEYDDKTESSNKCIYGVDNNLIKFGDVPIYWNGGE